MTEQQLTSIFSDYPHRSLTFPDGIRAAVLCPVFIQDNQPHLLFIKRSQQVKHHKGEISFPGGIKEPDDRSLLETCLRETMEEVGIQQQDITIIGRLDDVDTTTGFLVSPFLGIISYPYPFILNEQEVDHLVTVPIKDFIDASSQFDFYYFDGRHLMPLVAYYLGGQVIWGATARIVERLVTLLRQHNLLPAA
ncbi:MAG: CoA pyrophosphatase [Deltaproteobacteria bacterium]|nr:CoA pyrophosphatase [Candidatus Anaeroferrophillus wilburensis]MBN2888844.1 CoA pyrophosphatase [Deltaproteobacteria bacterium]